MSRPLKLLFVCSQNQWRSPTAERIFHGVHGCEARSAGTEDGARIKVNAGLIGWADKVFVMEKKHVRRLEEKFREEIAGKELICLNVPDDYHLMDAALIACLQSAVEPHLDWPR